MKKQKKAVPQEHWEIQYSPNLKKDLKELPGTINFEPKVANERLTTYNKVNKTDH